jgi:hypothetical protein
MPAAETAPGRIRTAANGVGLSQPLLHQEVIEQPPRGGADEEVFPGYLRQARALLAGLPGRLDDGPTGLSPEFEVLRWFPLPPGCLSPT